MPEDEVIRENEISFRAGKIKRFYIFHLCCDRVGGHEAVGCSHSFSSNPSCKLNVLGHYRDPLGMNSTKIGVFKESNHVRLGRFLNRSNRSRLKPQITLELLCYLTHQSLERQLPDEKFCRLLELADLAEGDGAWSEAVRLFDAAFCWRVLAGGFVG